MGAKAEGGKGSDGGGRPGCFVVFEYFRRVWRGVTRATDSRILERRYNANAVGPF